MKFFENGNQIDNLVGITLDEHLAKIIFTYLDTDQIEVGTDMLEADPQYDSEEMYNEPDGFSRVFTIEAYSGTGELALSTDTIHFGIFQGVPMVLLMTQAGYNVYSPVGAEYKEE